MATTTMTHPLFDADAASVSDLAAHRRARTSVAELEVEAAYAERAERDAYRADLIERYIAACASGADEFAQLHLLAEAARYDLANPGDAVPLADELHGTQLLAEAA